MARFFQVIDRDDREPYAVSALTDQLDPGRSRMYRWVPNTKDWVRDDGLLRDYDSFPSDQVNDFEEIAPEVAAKRTRQLGLITARWVLARYKAVDERLSSNDLRLPVDVSQPRPTTDRNLVQEIATAPAGEWVRARQFRPDQSAAARKWISEVGLGRIKRLLPVSPLDVRQESRPDQIVIEVRRHVERASGLPGLAQQIAEQAHGLQLDKAGRPYIDHPRRVAERARDWGAPEEAVAAAWLHDVVEDTALDEDDLRARGIPEQSIAAVLAVTKRPGQSVEEYADRITRTPLAFIVKLADLADNTDPERMSMLDTETRTRLQDKYAHMYGALRERQFQLSETDLEVLQHAESPLISAE